MILYFSALGFLTGYLLTRLALQSELEPAKANIEVKTKEADVKVTEPGTQLFFT
jgi:hypothetical protein